MTHLLELREQRDLKQYQAQLDKHDLIILDELGYVPFTKEGAELLFEVVSRAYERVSLIVTNQPAFRAMDGGDGQRAPHGCDVK